MPAIVKITSAGLAAAIAASGNGLQITLTHIALGATAFDPTGDETALPDIREVQSIAPGSVTGNNSFIITATFASYAGSSPYSAGSVGIYAGVPGAGGVLFAVASSIGNVFSLRQPGGASLTPAFTVALSGVPEGSVTINVDPTAAAIAAFLAAHVALNDPHPQYSTPVGMTAMHYASVAPAGWLELNGQLVNRADYPLLWAHVEAQTAVVPDASWAAGNWGRFSSGNGSTTFRLPDGRGEFLRAADRGRGVDPSRSLYSWQTDEFRSHTHSVPGEGNGTANYPPRTVAVGDRAPVGIFNLVAANGGNETRPRNIALLLCVFAGRVTVPAGPPPAASPAPVPPPAPTPVGPPAPGPAPAPPPAGSPDASFGFLRIGGLFVEFFDSSTNSPTSWLWQFGDGVTSTEQNPTHQYDYFAAFDVFLTVTNQFGSSTTSRYVLLNNQNTNPL